MREGGGLGARPLAVDERDDPDCVIVCVGHKDVGVVASMQPVPGCWLLRRDVSGMLIREPSCAWEKAIRQEGGRGVEARCQPRARWRKQRAWEPRTSRARLGG